MLAKGETADKYREVTDAEKAALEMSDAQWVRPKDWVIDLFNADPNGRYNEATGMGELNGLIDITPQQMTDIAYYGVPSLAPGELAAIGSKPLIRTNLTPKSTNAQKVYSLNRFAAAQKEMEILRLVHGNYEIMPVENNALEGALGGRKIRKIFGIINCANIKHFINTFNGALSLEEVQLKRLSCNLSLEWSPLLSLESIAYMVTEAANTAPITVTVHADVYDKLTDPDNIEWNALVGLAADKQITFTTNN